MQRPCLLTQNGQIERAPDREYGCQSDRCSAPRNGTPVQDDEFSAEGAGDAGQTGDGRSA
jgi:hypothetical protein